jgi:hypothetical protein
MMLPALFYFLMNWMDRHASLAMTRLPVTASAARQSISLENPIA